MIKEIWDFFILVFSIIVIVWSWINIYEFYTGNNNKTELWTTISIDKYIELMEKYNKKENCVYDKAYIDMLNIQKEYIKEIQTKKAPF